MGNRRFLQLASLYEANRDELVRNGLNIMLGLLPSESGLVVTEGENGFFENSKNLSPDVHGEATEA